MPGCLCLLVFLISCHDKRVTNVEGYSKFLVPPYAIAKSNLGDLYGKANRFKECYAGYWGALEKYPNQYHSLTGIAWLACSNDKDIAGAFHICSNKANTC